MLLCSFQQVLVYAQKMSKENFPQSIMLLRAFLVFSNFLLMSVIFGDIFERTTFNVVLIPYADT